MTRKIIAGMGVAAAAAVLASALVAGAQSATPSAPQVLQVGPQGHVLMRGAIATVSTGVVTVNSWGGAWTVNVGSGTQILPSATGSGISQFKQGDFVGVEGTVSTSSPWTINATILRDWTYRQAVNQERRTNIQSVRTTMRSESPRDYQGIASNVNAAGMSLTLTSANGTAYSVVVASGAKVLERNWLTFTFSSIQNGDTVRVWGPNASGTITAEVVRDVSMPAAGTGTSTRK